MLRQNEAEEVLGFYRDQLNLNIIHVDARERFLSKLAGVTDPEQKRKIIGTEFVRVFEEEAKKLGGAEWLLQGTIYPDAVSYTHLDVYKRQDGHLSLRRCKARLSERQAHVIRILHSACHAASRMISPTVGCGKMIFFTCASVMPVSTNTAAVEMNAEA